MGAVGHLVEQLLTERHAESDKVLPDRIRHKLGEPKSGSVAPPGSGGGICICDWVSSRVAASRISVKPDFSRKAAGPEARLTLRVGASQEAPCRASHRRHAGSSTKAHLQAGFVQGQRADASGAKRTSRDGTGDAGTERVTQGWNGWRRDETGDAGMKRVTQGWNG